MFARDAECGEEGDVIFGGQLDIGICIGVGRCMRNDGREIHGSVMSAVAAVMRGRFGCIANGARASVRRVEVGAGGTHPIQLHSCFSFLRVHVWFFIHGFSSHHWCLVWVEDTF